MASLHHAPRTRVLPSRHRLNYRLRRESFRNQPAAADTLIKETSLGGEIETLKDERDRLKDALLRSRAELENFRRRVERDREEMAQQRAREAVMSVLPVLDNFERAVQAASGAADAASVLSGVAMIRDQFRAALAALGLEPVAALGAKFDPAFHEAVAVEERDDIEDNQVVDVLQDGFILGGKLVRPAMVRVGRRMKN